MSIPIPPEPEARPSESRRWGYLERIAWDELAEEEELQVLALEGLNSGASVPADDRYGEQKHMGARAGW